MPTRYGGSGRTSTKARLADELMLLGEVLATARERAGVKQSDAAARLGAPASWLSKVENGTRRLDVIELLHLAEAIGVDPAEILHELQQRLAIQGAGPRSDPR